MLFNSVAFLIFFPIVTIIYFLLPHRFRWLWLLGASCYFYMAFVPVYILILGGTIVIDYFAGIWIQNAQGQRRRLFLVLSIISNVGVLAAFKYFNFLNDNLSLLLHGAGYQNPIPFLKILLPIGLSFHTFQAMSYTIEVYRGNQPAEKHFGIYALYVMFYPQLVAGPIERPQNMLHQFHEKKTYDYDNLRRGICLIVWGLFKKVVIADRLALFVDQVYDTPHSYHGLPLIVATVFFAFQIYFDFSGYSDIARGAARAMGFNLMINFNFPFTSTSIGEFWRKWHISLSTWFNDYVFSPILIAKRNWGKRAVLFALFVTFFISGLWHGAGWNFVIFGVLHGLALIYETLTKRFRKSMSKAIPSIIYKNLSMLIVFAYACFAWIFFRAVTVRDSVYIIKNMFRGLGGQLLAVFRGDPLVDRVLYVNQGASIFLLSCALIVLVELLQIAMRKRDMIDWLAGKNVMIRYTIYYTMVLGILALGVLSSNKFIYFQF